jgi:DNA-binding CsgD family transcriptional regulator
LLTGADLVERDAELETLDDAIEATLAGQGGVVVIEGPAGIGKSSLLNEMGIRSVARGMRVTSAQGMARERDFSFGVVRQLFEPVFGSANAALRRRLLEGAAALAMLVVAAETAQTPSIPGAVVHGLYWLVANLAETAPVLLAVDDVHWADSPSLQFIAYLARRLEGLPVLLLLAIRSGDPSVDPGLIGDLMSDPGAQVIRPAALSVEGVGEVVRRHFGGSGEPGFVQACRAVTGGVPFLVEELMSNLSAGGVQPTARAVARIARAGPSTVAQSTIRRMSVLSPSTVAVAQAVAVLGRQARLDRIATLSGVDSGVSKDALDSLIKMQILAPGRPTRFVHPLVHQAIYDDMPAMARADGHGRAARLLAEQQAPADEVASHLLFSEPMGDQRVVETLRSAAGQALTRGAPQSAVAYLRRAVEEGATHDRASLLRELGGGEGLIRDPMAVGHLEEARRLSDDAATRAGIGLELATLKQLSGDWIVGMELAREALAELGDKEPEQAAEIEVALLGTESYDSRFARSIRPRLTDLEDFVVKSGPKCRSAALRIAGIRTCRAWDLNKVPKLLELGLDGGRYLRDEGSESLALPQAIMALIGLEKLDLAEQVAQETLADARRRGSVLGFVAGSIYALLVNAQRGMLASAESHLRSAVDRCIEHGMPFVLPTAFLSGADVLLERPEVDDIAALIESVQISPNDAFTCQGAWVLSVRGRLRALQGDREGAASDLRAAADIFEAMEFKHPFIAPWRSQLALLLPAEAIEEARRLMQSELQDSRAIGSARYEGMALRAAGCLEGGESGIELLEESLRTLAGPDLTLERARTLVEMGAAKRRANHRLAAQEPLRAGLELAHRCGAERLAARAEEELKASGARPRRRVLSGPEALTPSEARVARMASDGMTNRQIAQSLFVTAKTVENQLGFVFQKLGLTSRDQLPSALGEGRPLSS